MEADRTAEWTNDNIQTLLNVMKSNIPSRESEKTWSAGLKTIDWEDVAFEPFSSEECRAKWQEIMQKLRKVKSLTELIVDAQNAMANPVTTPAPKFPKKPVSANALFYSENMDTLRKKHPEMHSRELMKYANKVYRRLPAKDKEKYEKKVLIRKAQYKAKVITDCDNSEADTETHLVPPPKPPMTAYNLFCREQKSCMTGVPQVEITTVWAQRWKKLSPEEKAKYSRRCYEMKEEYNDKLNNLLSGMNKKTRDWMIQKHHLKMITLKKKPATDKLFPGEPCMPISITAHELFYNTQLTKKKTRMEDLSKAKFNSLSPQKKQFYHEKVDKNLQLYSVKLQQWFETLTAAEQQEYCEHNPNKLKFLRCSRGLRTSYHRTSDSEDEGGSSSSSSSGDSDDVVLIEPNENEEEEDDIMFDIF